MSLLERLFGDSRNRVWRKLARELGGTFHKGSLVSGSYVQVDEGPWTITLDTYSVQVNAVPIFFTRLRAPYVNPDGFRFHIKHEGFFDRLGKAFGLEDIQIGDKAFDSAFLIHGNNATKVQALLLHEPLRKLLLELPQVNFSVRSDQGWWQKKFPEGVDELYFEVAEEVRNLEQLETMFSLFAETLNTLCHLGSAYEDDPGIELKPGRPEE